MDQEVLKKSERGHTAEQVCLAVQQLKKAGLSVGLQFMVGLPGEDGASLRRTAVGESDCIRTLSEFIRCLCWKGQRWQIHGDRGNTVPAHWNQLCAPAHS